MSLSQNIEKRLISLNRHNASADLQAMAKVYYADRPVDFINDWVWTFDPRLSQPYVPFMLYPVQEQFIGWLEERVATKTDGVVEKSRDVGATFLMASYLIHKWLFVPGFKSGIGSRKLSLVDTLGDPDSIFEKLRLILRYLPTWFLPDGFTDDKHMTFCKLLNAENGAAITGEAGDQIGRGGRNTLYFIDEAAFIERPQRIEASLASNTDIRIDVSTTHGIDNPFAKKRHSGNISVFVFDWHDDPRKSHWEVYEKDKKIAEGKGGTQPPALTAGQTLVYPWYESQKVRIGNKAIIAQELDRDYMASIEGAIIPGEWVSAAINSQKLIDYGNCDQTIIAGFDVADGGDNLSVFVTRRGPVVTSIQTRSSGGTTDTALWARDLAYSQSVAAINFDSVGVGAGVAGAYQSLARTGDLAVDAHGINTGERPTSRIGPTGLPAYETFVNLRAELWWGLRERFEKTWERIEEGVNHPAGELISIPNDSKLIAQLTTPTWNQNTAGKILLESKADMAQRGIASPDYADALVLAFAPVVTGSVQSRYAVGGKREKVAAYIPR